MTRQELMLPSSAAENLLLSRLAFITTSHINPKKGKTIKRHQKINLLLFSILLELK